MAKAVECHPFKPNTPDLMALPATMFAVMHPSSQAQKGRCILKFTLKSKIDKPAFSFFVRTNTAGAGYYLFADLEQALNKARVLSLTQFPLVIVYEPCQDKDGEWHLIKTYSYFSGKCHLEEDAKPELHVKFYLEAYQWLNPDEPILTKEATQAAVS